MKAAKIFIVFISIVLLYFNAEGQFYKLEDGKIKALLYFCDDSMFNIIRTDISPQRDLNNISIGFYTVHGDTVILNDGLNHFKNVLIKEGETYKYLEGFDFLKGKRFLYRSAYSSCICDKDFYLRLVEKDNNKFEISSKNDAPRRKYKNERLIGKFHSNSPFSDDVFEFHTDNTFSFKFNNVDCFSGKWHIANDLVYLNTEIFNRVFVLRIKRHCLQSIYLPDFIRTKVFLKNSEH